MSNALRMFIRESLTNEAVGHTTWIRPAGTVSAYSRQKNDDQNTILSTILGAASKTSAYASRKYKDHRAKSKLKSPKAGATNRLSASSGIAAAVSALLSGGLALYAGSRGGNEADVDAAQGDFYNELEEIRLANDEILVENLRTKEIRNASSGTDVDALINNMVDNYSYQTNALIKASSYDSFFSLPAIAIPYTNIKGKLDSLIDQYDNQDADSKAKLQKFVFYYLLYHTSISMQEAYDTDSIALNQGAGEAGLTSEEKQKLSTNLETFLTKISNDPEWIEAKRAIESLTE